MSTSSLEIQENFNKTNQVNSKVSFIFMFIIHFVIHIIKYYICSVNYYYTLIMDHTFLNGGAFMTYCVMMLLL